MWRKHNLLVLKSGYLGLKKKGIGGNDIRGCGGRNPEVVVSWSRPWCSRDGLYGLVWSPIKLLSEPPGVGLLP